MNRTVQFATWIIMAIAVLVLINEIHSQTVANQTGIVRSVFEPDATASVKDQIETVDDPNRIPEGFCLAAFHLDASAPSLSMLKAGQQVDVFCTDAGRLHGGSIRRLISGAKIYSVDLQQGAPATTVVLLIRRKFADAFLLARRSGDIELTVVKQTATGQDLAKQSLEFQPGSPASMPIDKRISIRTPADEDPAKRFSRLRQQLGGPLREMMKDIEAARNGRIDNGGSLADQAFEQRISDLMQQKDPQRRPRGKKKKHPPIGKGGK